MDAGIVVALIGAAVSLVVACLSAVSARGARRASEGHDARMRQLDVRLNDLSEERSARREYEYEARKRLYTTIEPLLFQLAELAEAAHGRIVSLARTAASGDLGDERRSWLAGEGYYLVSTMHRLLSPLAVVELMRRQLTTVDLALDPNINVQYELARHLLGSFDDDFRLAAIEPAVDYRPDESPSGHGDEPGLPVAQRRQGIYAGRSEQAINALIQSDPERIITFGEFEAVYESTPALKRLSYLFLDFHPQRHRVLWRVLVAQAHLYRAILGIRDAKLHGDKLPDPPIKWIPQRERSMYDWRQDSQNVPDSHVAEPFTVVETYLRTALPGWTPGSE